MDTLSNIANLILTVFAEDTIMERDTLSIFDLLFKKAQWDRHHQHEFTKAINELHDVGLIEWGEQYALALTTAGHQALSQQGR